ncbi:chaperonin 10-like protein [Pseudomassariella vexata]|uniref:Chaperonin 10-like protein n=1 Tax=Pseudomassariella vexata TaxID=1141098 RepID=A0A1Y2DVY2_9PEZI|nr:chaperonin 10-like protein [Pseudomassariella vexata]ORY63296.1 chaperonin 10-like protein [Pseudomassariella vexata]
MASITPTDSKTNTMKAWLYSSAGQGLEKSIKLSSDAPQPPLLGKDDILVKVHAMSPNPADYKFPELGLLARVMISVPASPGMDYAGTVVKTGSAVDTFKIGEEVFGRVEPNRFGTLGEYIVAKYSGCVSRPQGLGLEEACCVGTTGLTAYQSIAPHVTVGNGDKVFINGGSGGTGTFGVQIAKALGCHVTTSCSGKNVELCKSLGADEVIDYTKENVSAVLAAKGLVFKLVVDNFIQVGASVSLAQLKSTVSTMLLPSFLGGGKSSISFIMTKNSHDDLVELRKLITEGRVKSVVDEVFEYEDAPKAYEKLKTGRARGNLVVKGPKHLHGQSPTRDILQHQRREFCIRFPTPELVLAYQSRNPETRIFHDGDRRDAWLPTPPGLSNLRSSSLGMVMLFKTPEAATAWRKRAILAEDVISGSPEAGSTSSGIGCPKNSTFS